MVSADGIIHKQRQTLAYLEFTEAERPFGIQIFGSNPLIMAKATEIILHHNPDFIDINMGCPVKKVVKRGAGGALMSDIGKAVEIVSEVKRVLPNGFPLSVKFRSGNDITKLNYLDFGKAMQDAGADIVTLHPRTVKQVFTGVSNWQHIKELKKALSVPVIGNGDIKSVAEGLEMFELTGCDSIMIGRGALGHPWMFKQIKDKINGSEITDVTLKDKLEILVHHLDEALTVKPERLVVREIRSHLCFYTKGLNGGAKLRNSINQTETIFELKKILTEAFGF